MEGSNNHRQTTGQGAGLAVALSEAEIENTFCVNVKFSDGKTFPLSFKPNQTIGDLKVLLAGQADLPSRSVNLVFAGQLLKDDQTVEDYGLGGHTTLHAFCWSDDGLGGVDLNTNSLVSNPGLSRFFVFCKLCNCVRPGLLRVVCKSCGSGLFVVNYGPSCWEDISSDTALKGKCKNENCTSEAPRFYLRCSQRHLEEVEGTAAALKHVQSNRRRIECIICQDVSSLVLIFPCPPGHVMCLNCFHQYAASSLEERRFVENEEHGYTLPCPAACENFFIEDSHHFLLLGREKYERFKNFGAEEYVLKNGGVLCPTPNCGMGIFPDDDNRLIKCTECQLESCRDCKRAYHFDSCHDSLLSEIHNPSNLLVDRNRAERARWENQSLNLIGEISKACPGCTTKTERSGGCMHIVCTRCGADWCWLCVKPWDRECQASHWFGY